MITDRLTAVLEQPDLMHLPNTTQTLSPLDPAPRHFKSKKLWLNLHLYLGLFGGGLFVLMSLTGSFLVFYKTIDEWLNPTLVTTSGEGSYRPLNEIVTAARGAGPIGGVLDSVEWPSHNRGVFIAWYNVQISSDDEVRWIQVAIDPYTGAVLTKDREWGGYAVSFIYELHQSLLINTVGETILGFVAILLLVSIGTGVYLWWPRPGRLRQAVTFTSGGSRIRRQYEWHRLTGFYGGIFLGMLAFTGIYLEFGEYVVSIVRLFSPVQEYPDDGELRSHLNPGVLALSVEQAVALATQVFPDGEVRYLGLPHDDQGVYDIAIHQPGEIRETSGQGRVWIDQYSGAVLKVRDWQTFTAGETFLAWLFPLHNGEAFGLVGRWIVFFAGFIPLLLYVTALRMWWLKRQAHRRQNRRPSAEAHPCSKPVNRHTLLIR